MAFRKFRGVEYPVPGIDTAIQVLRPGAKYDLNNTTFLRWEDELGREPPTWEEICREVEKELEIYNYYSWERDRQKHYPEIKDQLDMLYHDIKSGEINNGEWIKSIDLIKNKYPKPKNSEP